MGGREEQATGTESDTPLAYEESSRKPYSRLLVTDEAFISPTFSVNAVFLYTSTPPDREHHAIYRRRRRLPRFFFIFDFFSPPPSTLSRHGSLCFLPSSKPPLIGLLLTAVVRRCYCNPPSSSGSLYPSYVHPRQVFHMSVFSASSSPPSSSSSTDGRERQQAHTFTEFVGHVIYNSLAAYRVFL